jgi:hypothetical protein
MTPRSSPALALRVAEAGSVLNAGLRHLSVDFSLFFLLSARRGGSENI